MFRAAEVPSRGYRAALCDWFDCRLAIYSVACGVSVLGRPNGSVCGELVQEFKLNELTTLICPGHALCASRLNDRGVMSVRRTLTRRASPPRLF